MATTDPLPLVPATMTVRYDDCGSSIARTSRRMVSSPGLIPKRSSANSASRGSMYGGNVTLRLTPRSEAGGTSLAEALPAFTTCGRRCLVERRLG